LLVVKYPTKTILVWNFFSFISTKNVKFITLNFFYRIELQISIDLLFVRKSPQLLMQSMMQHITSWKEVISKQNDSEWMNEGKLKKKNNWNTFWLVIFFQKKICLPWFKFLFFSTQFLYPYRFSFLFLPPGWWVFEWAASHPTHPAEFRDITENLTTIAMKWTFLNKMWGGENLVFIDKQNFFYLLMEKINSAKYFWMIKYIINLHLYPDR